MQIRFFSSFFLIPQVNFQVNYLLIQCIIQCSRSDSRAVVLSRLYVASRPLTHEVAAQLKVVSDERAVRTATAFGTNLNTLQ